MLTGRRFATMSVMPPRLPSMCQPPISFAHRGARALEPENTLAAFSLALRLGAKGLESDAWLTADGQVVLDHDGEVGGRLRRRSIRTLQRADLPAHIPTLGDLYAGCGTGYELSLDLKDPAALAPMVAISRAAGVAERLWICHPDWNYLASVRRDMPDVKLVDSTRLSRFTSGPERRAAQLRHAGIDAVNLHASDWTGGLIALFHRFERLAFGWDAQLPRVLAELLDAGIDAVYSDYVDRMVDAVDALRGTDPLP